jgi:glucokinase
MQGFVLSVDVGGTKTLVAAINRSGKILAEWQKPTRSSAEDDILEVARFARDCYEVFVADEPSNHRLFGIAAGFPEYVSASGQLMSHEVLNWQTQPLVALARQFGGEDSIQFPIVIESDVRLGAKGEAEFGAGSKASSSFYVSLGTGLSSAFVTNAQVWTGERGEAIALGEHTIAVRGFKNLESYSSGAGIESRYHVETGNKLPGVDISYQATKNDLSAIWVLDTAGKALGDALANVAHILDPHTLVLGGGLGSSVNRVTLAAIEQYNCQMSQRSSPPLLITADLGHRSALFGAAALAWSKAVSPFPNNFRK